MTALHLGSHIPSRFESDADTLPFPEGGVFGRKPAVLSSRSAPTMHEAELVIARLQSQFDALTSQLDEVMRLPSRNDWQPPAA